MWEERAHRARCQILDLAAGDCGLSQVYGEAIAVVGRTVGSELTCWAAIDPDTLTISAMVSGEVRIPVEYEPLLAEAECSASEPHTFAELARRRRSVAQLSELTAHERDASLRAREVWRPLGLDQEARTVFVTDGACWGAAGMVRSGRDFDERELEFLRAVAPAIASVSRLAALREAALPDGGTAPAIVVLGGYGELRSATSAAQAWRGRFDAIAPHRFELLMRLMWVGSRESTGHRYRVRVRDGRARWAVLEASPLVGGAEPEVAVLISGAGADDVGAVLLAAYGLTDRERDIVREVASGRSTLEIGHRLFISPYTVQDHLKSIFSKVGVHSRGELVDRLRPAA
ncbi:helix-turn-helix transcriptional regulator [Leifsonia shinshuensis]|uniref:helix-turn-helix transcriptional regulator n=1 Tax=Leifsonia shinshuensis TaxID=150026 RepID=UPI002866FCC8|nr:helix-turn-helix transcriptional regulator [Leifsonia shinshuensis]MDR6973159.1 DNA-binding CsgD family transcriptional regulator [Leifsonia shinshuensis]